MKTLQPLKNILENNPAMAFIFQRESRTLIYMNRRARETFLDDADAAYKGLLYKDVIPFLCEPEAEKKRAALQQDDSFEWHYLDIYSGNEYSIVETVMEDEGTDYVIGSMNDQFTVPQSEQELIRRANNEKLLNNALGYALNESDPEDAIQTLIRYLGEHMECDRFYIFEEVENHTFSNTYEWCRPGITHEKDNLQNLPYEGIVDTWYRELDLHGNIIIRNLEQYRSVNQAVYEILKPQDIQTLVVGPLTNNGRRIGFFGVDNPPLEHIDALTTLYQVLGHFLSIMLRYRDKEERLQELSYIDQLTGLNNRHALYQYLQNSDQKQSRSYIFCDLNGLKKVNDLQGHDKGDAFICKAGEVLRKTFDPVPIFRMGGDEFLAVCFNLSEEETYAKENTLRQNFADAGISSAIGSAWYPDGSVSPDKMIQEADARMYEDKREIYGGGCSR